MTPQEALDTLVSHARDFTDGTPAEAEVAAAADTLRAALAASGWTLAPVQTEDLPNGVPCRCVLLAGRCGCPCHADEAKVYYSEAEANAMLAAARSPHPAPDPLREALSAIEELPKWDKRSVPGGFHVNRADVLDILRAALAAPGLTLVPVQTEDLPNGVPCRCVLLAGRCGCPCHNDDVPAPDPLREAMTLTLALYTDLVEVLAMTVGETPEGRYECRMCESDVTSTPHSDDCEAERLRKWTYAAIPAAPARPVQDSNPLSRTPDPDPLRAHQYDHDGMARHHHDCDTGAAIWWSNAEQFGGVRVEHQKVADERA